MPNRGNINLQPHHLQDDIVYLKPIVETDFDRLFKVAADPSIWEQHPSRDRYKKEVFQLYFDSAISSGSAFLIAETSTNRLIGCTRFYDYNPALSRIAIGYTFLAKEYWGGKYNRAVKKLLLDYAFQFVHSVVFHIGPTNIRSQQAILRLGAKQIGEEHYNGTLQFLYEIRRSDWLISSAG